MAGQTPFGVIPASPAALSWVELLRDPEGAEFALKWRDIPMFLLERDGHAVGVLALSPHPEVPGSGWGTLWIAPKWRKRWFSRSVWRALGTVVFSTYLQLIAATADKACQGNLLKLGFHKYCEDADVGYYCLTKEAYMRGHLLA